MASTAIEECMPMSSASPAPCLLRPQAASIPTAPTRRRSFARVMRLSLREPSFQLILALPRNTESGITFGALGQVRRTRTPIRASLSQPFVTFRFVFPVNATKILGFAAFPPWLGICTKAESNSSLQRSVLLRGGRLNDREALSIGGRGRGAARIDERAGSGNSGRHGDPQRDRRPHDSEGHPLHGVAGRGDRAAG